MNSKPYDNLYGQYKMQTTDCRLEIGFKMQTRQKMPTADCRLGVKCRLRPVASSDTRCISMTFRDLKVTQCRSRNLFREHFLLGLFNSKKVLVSTEDLSLFFNLKHKHLVICFTVKGIQIKAFRRLPIVIRYK